MQTPSRTVEPQTPMVPLERRMDAAYERELIRAQESVRPERPQITGLGRVVLEMEQLNKNMRSIQNEIQSDIRARRKFFEQEQKLLKKDIDNQKGFQAAALFDLRKIIGLASFGIAANELAQGDIGGAAQGIGLGTAAFLPEIVQGVIGILAAKGLIGAGAKGSGVLAGGLGLLGGGKAKGILALAALGGLLLTGGALASNSSDRTRRQDILEEQRGQSTINSPDVVRFRSQLTRADSILLDIKNAKKDKKTTKIEIDPKDIKKTKNKNKNQMSGQGGSPSIDANKLFNEKNQDDVKTDVATKDGDGFSGEGGKENKDIVATQNIVPQKNDTDDKDTSLISNLINILTGSQSAAAGTLEGKDKFIGESKTDDVSFKEQDGKLIVNNEGGQDFELSGASKEKVGDDRDFLRAIAEMSNRRNMDPSLLLGAIASESSFDPTAVNKTTGAAGIFQLKPEIAKELGTSTDEILEMSRVEQLKLMDKFFDKIKLPDNATAGQLKTSIVLPNYAMESDSYELMTKFSKFSDGQRGFPDVYERNKNLDTNNDGFITVGELGKNLTNKIEEFGIRNITNTTNKTNISMQGGNGENKNNTFIINGDNNVQEIPPLPEVPDNATGNVNVSTIFNGSIDKLESAFALDSYAAFV